MGCPNTSNFVKNTPLRIGVRARGAGGAAASTKFGQVSFLGQQEKSGQKVFKTFRFVSRNYNVTKNYGWPFVSKLQQGICGFYCRVYLSTYVTYGL